MAFPVRSCALVGRFADPRIAESVGALLPHLASRGVQVLIAADAHLAPSSPAGSRACRRSRSADAPTWSSPSAATARCCTRARLVARHGVPLLGVNRGRLGFLTDVMPQDMLQSVDAALAGQPRAR